jgi:hypothetical protein
MRVVEELGRSAIADRKVYLPLGPFLRRIAEQCASACEGREAKAVRARARNRAGAHQGLRSMPDQRESRSYLYVQSSKFGRSRRVLSMDRGHGRTPFMMKDTDLDAQAALRDVDAFVSTMQERRPVRLGDGRD